MVSIPYLVLQSRHIQSIVFGKMPRTLLVMCIACISGVDLSRLLAILYISTALSFSYTPTCAIMSEVEPGLDYDPAESCLAACRYHFITMTEESRTQI